MAQTATVLNVLVRAREIIDRDGWRRGAIYGTPDHVLQGAKCALNAKRAAVRDIVAPEIEVMPVAQVSEFMDLSIAAERLLAQAVVVLCPEVKARLYARVSSGGIVIHWNDTVAQSKDDALALYDKAIELAQGATR